MAPLFSIILPTYNRAVMLRTALKSILAQTCRDYECYVLDDGSTDETPAVFKEFSAEPNFHFERFEDNRRQHARRNYAILRAQGLFVTFLDSDDIWLPQRLELFAQAIKSRPQTDFWFSNAYLYREGRIMGTVFDPRRFIEEGRVPGWHAVGERYLPYLTTNLAVRREVFGRIGLFREDMKILEDTELYARMLKDGIMVGAIHKPLAVRRLHAEQITMDHKAAYQEALMALSAGGLSSQDMPAEKERLTYSVADYLIKSLKPQEARQFLLQELGDKAKSSRAYRLTFIPSGILRLAKAARRLYLRLRFSSLCAPPDFKETNRLIAPLLASEK